MKFLSLILWVASAAWGQQPSTTAVNDAGMQPALRPIEDVAGLPRVLLIGDSISIGYTLPVREKLKGKANVHRVPANGATTKLTLANLDKWLGSGKWDVIHVNWGLHDLRIMEDGKHQVSIEDYEKNLQELATRLKKTGARVIFATTTPVPEGKVSPMRVPADVPKYNAVAVKVMKKNHVAIDDLYAAMNPRLKEFQRPVNVHFTDPGYEFLAGFVVKSINKKLHK